MVAFVPKFRLMVTFIPKTALMATIRVTSPRKSAFGRVGGRFSARIGCSTAEIDGIDAAIDSAKESR